MYMQFGLAFGHFINKPGGVKNVLFYTLCALIPVVGPIICGGYRAEAAVALIRDPYLTDHPDFDFNRISKYLMRGVWPFLIGLLLGVLFFVPAAVAIGFGVAAGIAGGDPLIGFLVGITLFLAAWLGLILITVPMTFHAELINRFDLAEGFRFAQRFWSVAAGPAIAAGLIFIPLAMIVAILGLLCCFVGIYPASSIIQMAANHLTVQVYREYLERGGEPIELVDPEEFDDSRRDRRREREWEDDDDRI
jgi:hypothetical protein